MPTLYDVDASGDLIFEYCPWPTLEQWIDQGHRWSAEQAHRALCHAAVALRDIHRLNIAHGDIAPDNVCIGPQQQIRLIDFGGSVALGQPAISIRQDFSAPEVLAGRAPTEASDIFALGRTMALLIQRSSGIDRSTRQHGNPLVIPCPRIAPI